MTDPVRELLEAVRAKPEDDAPRQVLADLYEERGQTERAAFIRAQLEQASLPRWDPRWLDLELDARAPLLEHWDAWRAELPVIGGVRWGSFERGLVRSVAFDDAALVAQHAEAAMTACPVRAIATRWPRMGDRPELPVVPGLRELAIVGTVMQREDVEWLARCPILSTVHTLRLVGSRMTDDALPVLLASPHLGRLRALAIPHHHFGNDAIDALVAADLSLTELDLSVETQDQIGSMGREDTVVGEMGIARLASAPSFASIERLNITGIQLGEVGLMAVLASPHNGRLRALGIRSVSDYDMESYDRPDVLNAFEHARAGVAIEELDIGENELTQESAYELAESKALAGLKVLRLEMNSGDTAELQTILATAPWFDSVAALHLDDNHIGALDAVLARAPESLAALSLASSYPWSSLEGLPETLAAGPNLPTVRWLDLTGCALGDAGLAALGEVRTLPGLVALRLGVSEYDEEVAYTETGAKAFAESHLGKQLRCLVTDLGPDVDRLPDPPMTSIGDDEDEYVL